jgi:hypothetical protein
MYENYCNYIKSLLDKDINQIDFKSNNIYNNILEHVPKEMGDDYLSVIKDKFGDIFNNNLSYITKICRMNDYIGKPKIYEYSNFIQCSPSNLRYILHSFLILNYMKNCKLNNVNIIEIGGGYGGLCFYLFKLCYIFDININSYVIFDLDEPSSLQKKYLSFHNIYNVKYYNLKNYDKEQLFDNSFLISNYAFSEIPKEIQIDYTINILNPYTSHGFLTWNHIDVYNFISDKNIRIEEEYPLTGNGNKYVYFE